MSTELQQVTQAVAEFDRVAAGLAALQEQYGGIVYDVTSAPGMKEAKEARAAIREPRYEVERIRKAAKAPILALGKKLDSEAARITTALLKIEAPIDTVISAEEARKESEKAARIAAELKRAQDLQERVAELRGNQMLSPTSGSILISDHIQDLEEITVDDSFQELRQQAEDAKAAGLKRLGDLHAAALAHEAEQARIKAEREELARLRAEQITREAEDRARREAEERIARAARDEADRKARLEREAEAQRQAEALRLERAEAERQEAIRREAREIEERSAREERQRQEALLAAQREELARQEQEAAGRLADERAQFEREQETLRRVQPPKSAPKLAFSVPPPAEMIRVLAGHYRAHPDTVLDWLQAINWQEQKFSEVA
jgi:GTPase SAR1 family protein